MDWDLDPDDSYCECCGSAGCGQNMVLCENNSDGHRVGRHQFCFPPPHFNWPAPDKEDPARRWEDFEFYCSTCQQLRTATSAAERDLNALLPRRAAIKPTLDRNKELAEQERQQRKREAAAAAGQLDGQGSLQPVVTTRLPSEPKLPKGAFGAQQLRGLRDQSSDEEDAGAQQQQKQQGGGRRKRAREAQDAGAEPSGSGDSQAVEAGRRRGKAPRHGGGGRGYAPGQQQPGRQHQHPGTASEEDWSSGDEQSESSGGDYELAAAYATSAAAATAAAGTRRGPVRPQKQQGRGNRAGAKAAAGGRGRQSNDPRRTRQRQPRQHKAGGDPLRKIDALHKQRQAAAAAARRGAAPTAAAAAPAVRAPLASTSSGAGTSTGGARAAAAAQLQQQRRPPEAAAAAAGSSGGGRGGVHGLAAAPQPQRVRGPVPSVTSLIHKYYSDRPLQKDLVLELGVASVLRQSVAVTVSRPDRQAGGALVAAAPLQLCCKAANPSTQRLVTTDRLLETHHGSLVQALQQVSTMSGRVFRQADHPEVMELLDNRATYPAAYYQPAGAAGTAAAAAEAMSGLLQVGKEFLVCWNTKPNSLAPTALQLLIGNRPLVLVARSLGDAPAASNPSSRAAGGQQQQQQQQQQQTVVWELVWPLHEDKLSQLRDKLLHLLQQKEEYGAGEDAEAADEGEEEGEGEEAHYEVQDEHQQDAAGHAGPPPGQGRGQQQQQPREQQRVRFCLGAEEREQQQRQQQQQQEEEQYRGGSGAIHPPAPPTDAPQLPVCQWPPPCLLLPQEQQEAMQPPPRPPPPEEQLVGEALVLDWQAHGSLSDDAKQRLAAALGGGSGGGVGGAAGAAHLRGEAGGIPADWCHLDQGWDEEVQQAVDRTQQQQQQQRAVKAEVQEVRPPAAGRRRQQQQRQRVKREVEEGPPAMRRAQEQEPQQQLGSEEEEEEEEEQQQQGEEDEVVIVDDDGDMDDGDTDEDCGQGRHGRAPPSQAPVPSSKQQQQHKQKQRRKRQQQDDGDPGSGKRRQVLSQEVEQQLLHAVETKIEQMLASGELAEEDRGTSVAKALQVARQQLLRQAKKQSYPLL